jgi:hypothetical protein
MVTVPHALRYPNETLRLSDGAEKTASFAEGCFLEAARVADYKQGDVLLPIGNAALRFVSLFVILCAGKTSCGRSPFLSTFLLINGNALLITSPAALLV